MDGVIDWVVVLSWGGLVGWAVGYCIGWFIDWVRERYGHSNF